MIGDKTVTEAAKRKLVGERCLDREAKPQGDVEFKQVRMQTRVAINQM